MLSNIHLPTIRIGKHSINVFPYWVSLLIVGILFGLVGAFTVLRDGLQVTGLSNAIPWGLWISVDLSAIAMGGCAFVFGVIVYILRIKRFEVIGKLAVLLGFLGYSTAGMVLLFDLGQPLRFWHPDCLLAAPLPFVGSDHVRGAVLERVDGGSPADRAGAFRFPRASLADPFPHSRRIDEVRAQSGALAAQHQSDFGGGWSDPFPAPSGIAGCDLLGAGWTRHLVQPKRSGAVRVLSHERRHCPALRIERVCFPRHAPSSGQ